MTCHTQEQIPKQNINLCLRQGAKFVGIIIRYWVGGLSMVKEEEANTTEVGRRETTE